MTGSTETSRPRIPFAADSQDYGSNCICPVCSARLVYFEVLPETLYNDAGTLYDVNSLFCPNAECGFLHNDAVQDVVYALFTESPMTLSEAAEVAVSYTLDTELAEADNHFRVTDLDTADWVLRKQNEMVAQIAEIEAHANREIERIRARADQSTHSLHSRLLYLQTAFNGQLEDFALNYLAGKREKTIKGTFYGKLSIRTGQPTLDIREKDPALALLLANRPDLLKMDIREGDLKKAMIAGDDNLPEALTEFVELLPAEEKFSIKLLCEEK